MMCRKIPATGTTPRAIQHAAFQDISYPLTPAANGIEYEL